MQRILGLGVGLALFTGCIVVDHDDDHDDYYYDEPDIVVVEPVNHLPTVLDATAGCYWDLSYGDDIWYFEAFVDDVDGPYDIQEVWADVWDEWSGQYIQSFPLYPTHDPYIWYSDWLGSTTWLSCWNPNYTVDVVVYDSWNDYGVSTIWPNTY